MYYPKKLWLRKFKDKKGDSAALAFGDIFKDGRRPNRILTDMGQEFKSLLVQRAFQREGVQHCYTYKSMRLFLKER